MKVEAIRAGGRVMWCETCAPRGAVLGRAENFPQQERMTMENPHTTYRDQAPAGREDAVSVQKIARGQRREEDMIYLGIPNVRTPIQEAASVALLVAKMFSEEPVAFMFNDTLVSVKHSDTVETICEQWNSKYSRRQQQAARTR